MLFYSIWYNIIAIFNFHTANTSKASKNMNSNIPCPSENYIAFADSQTGDGKVNMRTAGDSYFRVFLPVGTYHFDVVNPHGSNCSNGTIVVYSKYNFSQKIRVCAHQQNCLKRPSAFFPEAFMTRQCRWLSVVTGVEIWASKNCNSRTWEAQ